MLSYRHAFHAGNHADVLKHYVFSLVLDYFNQKDKPYWVVDTHAGAGMYALSGEFAQKNAEFENGIARLMTAKNLPESLENFVKNIKNFNKNNKLKFLPRFAKNRRKRFCAKTINYAYLSCTLATAKFH